MAHLILLGDSIFDNGAYVRGGPDVCRLLREKLPSGHDASLLAVDGSTAADIPEQLRRLPGGATHLVLSVGGNDALMSEHLLRAEVANVAEAFSLFAGSIEAFERSYRDSMSRLLSIGGDLTVCTIYNANFADPYLARCVRLAISLFNDVILRVARENSVKVIDLRYVCTETSDYANDIEPSVAGGHKIASAIMNALGLSGYR